MKTSPFSADVTMATMNNQTECILAHCTHVFFFLHTAALSAKHKTHKTK